MPLKKCLLIRLGGIGDLLFFTPVLKYLVRDGYSIDINCKANGKAVFKNNPYVNKLIIHDESIKIEGIEEHWEQLSKGYDKVINYSGSIETSLLVDDENEKFFGDKEKRQTDVNYYDEMFRLAGYDIKGKLPELYLDNKERKWIKEKRKSFRNNFVLLWSLSGSGIHKAWPYTEVAALEMLDKYPEMIIVTSGDDACRLLEWDHPRTISISGKTSLREALLWTKVADLVIGPETGLLNAAGCWNTPKMIFYTHSKHENLSKYFKNAYPMQSYAECSPCYRMIRPSKQNPEAACNPIESAGRASACMVMIRPERVLSTVETIVNPVKRIDNPICPICGKDCIEIERVAWYECGCGVVFQNYDNLKNVYNEEYFDKYNHSKAKDYYDNQSKEFIPVIKKYISGNRFLEIGNSNDFILDSALWYEFAPEKIDINKNSLQSQHKTYIGDFESHVFDKTYDCIWASHVWEHFKDPLEALRKVHCLLRKDGCLYISMPDLYYFYNGTKFGHFHRKEHYIMWTMERFIEIAEQIGFKVIMKLRNDTPGRFISWNDFHIILQKENIHAKRCLQT